VLEVGRRMVREAADGAEAALREVFLENVDTGVENSILEGGPHFLQHALDKGGELHPLDQAVLLALCLDVGNSNPVDGLTNEEMTPYIERVLEKPHNWMVHSTALLERSWIEFERRKTADRAMLQIQALIDQHSTKLTVTQSTYQAIEDSAPVQQRVRYAYSLAYPSQFELKRDLASRYLRCQVFVSALSYFRELEMWDEVVTCYQLLQKPQRAELVVREQLKTGESPYMLTALADLTSNVELYERAWASSRQRYARAKRTLGKIFYDRGDFAACCHHLDQALQVQPMVATAWYLKGIACMRIERWEEAVQAFVRCVQQDTEIGEAWANIGAIYMRLQGWPKAYHALTEAYKLKRDDWKVLENLLHVTLNMKRWKETMRVMGSLLDLRHKSARPVHVAQLRYVMKAVVIECTGRESNDSEERSEARDKVVELPDLAVHLETLLQRISSSIKSDAQVWDVVADFYTGFGHYTTALDARTKQVRWPDEASSELLNTPCALTGDSFAHTSQRRSGRRTRSC
jgi:tetratricopeptide (TPR) repeat protein